MRLAVFQTENFMLNDIVLHYLDIITDGFSFLQVENLMMNVKPEEEEEVEADDTGSLPLPRRRRVVKKEPRVNIPLGSITTVSELNLDMVTGLTTELQQQIREQHQQQQGAPLADPQQQQHIVAELPREITLTLEKVTLDKMATQGLLVDHMQKIQQQHQHQEELQVKGISSDLIGVFIVILYFVM